MTPKYLSVCVKLLLKFTVFLMFVFSTSSTTQCTPKKTERDIYVIRNIGIKMCELKCAENGQCLSIEYHADTLTCRLSRWEPQELKKMDGFIILGRDHSHVPTGSCTSSMCSFGQRCLKTRSGKSVCVQDGKQNYPWKSPHHTVETQETLVSNPLHEACRKGDLDRVRQILSQGLVDINTRGEKHGRTPLMLAAKEGHCKIFSFLMSKGANASEVDNDCKNALQWACKGGHVSMVECVLSQYGISKNSGMPVLDAAFKGHIDVVEFLVCTGNNVSQVNRDGKNLLHIACTLGSMALAKYVVSKGSVDINSASKGGVTPLMVAASGGHIGTFKFLVSMGANVSRVDEIGNNVLHFASRMGRLAIVRYLVSKGIADINSRRKDGKTPLMVAAFGGEIGTFKFLVSMGANVSCVDEIGNNVLHLASRIGRLAIVRYLVSKGIVDINSRRKDGRTPLMEAASGNLQALYFLLNKGANASHVDDDGDNILHLASSGGDLDMVRYILSLNLIDINARNKDGETAAMIANREKKPKTYKLLASRGCPVK